MRSSGMNPLSRILDETLRKLDLTEAADGARAVMLWGKMTDWAAWGVMLVGSFVLMQVGYAVFMRARRGLSDVI